MKYSIYNSILPLTVKTSMLYNASSDKFLIFNKRFEPLLRTATPEEILETCSDFYQQLKTSGAIIDNDLDECKEIVNIAQKNTTNTERYQLIINPSMNCNFKCWYCYETHLPHSKMNENTVSRVKKLISHIIAGNNKLKHFSLSFFGGEPLLYYNDTVKPIIDFFRNECSEKKLNYTIHFTSNGFLVNDRILDHLKNKEDDRSFQITLDGDREKHNKVRFSTGGAGSYDRIIKNIKKLLASKIKVALRINYTLDNATSTKEILTDLKNISIEDRSYLYIDFQRVWQDKLNKNEDESVLDESLTAFKNEFSNVSDRYNNVNALKYPCYADVVNEAVVNYNGDIFKCTARNFDSSNRCGYLSENGEIIWDNINFMQKRQIARFEKKICQICRIFPLCNGGCSQRAVESQENEECVRSHNELEKDKIILARFYNNIVKNRLHASSSIQTT